MANSVQNSKIVECGGSCATKIVALPQKRFSVKNNGTHENYPITNGTRVKRTITWPITSQLCTNDAHYDGCEAEVIWQCTAL